MRFISSFFSVPELNKYSEEEFERLVWQAKLRRGDAVWVLPMGAGLLAAALWIGACVLLTLSMKLTGVKLSGMVLRGWGLANILVTVMVYIAVFMAMRWMLIVRSVRRIINKAACPFCEFSLVGLPVKLGWVRCPECWQRVYLHDHRLTEEDLVPEHERHKPLSGIGAGEMGAYRAPARQSRRRG
jgi:hypothetical protein